MNMYDLGSFPFIAALIMVILSSILGPILVTKYKDYLIRKNKIIDPLISSMESNKLVDEQLMHIKIISGADRVWISQFHNGGHFFPTGKSISKFSITYEHISPGISPLSEVFKNIPVSLFNSSLKELYEKDEILMPDFINDSRLGLNKFSYESTTKSTYMFALKTLDGIFIGNMGIEFINEEKDLDKECLQEIRNKSIAIGTIISTYLYQNN